MTRQPIATCDYCAKPTYGNHRYIQMAGTVSVLCGVCDDKWQDRYQQDTGEGERDD